MTKLMTSVLAFTTGFVMVTGIGTNAAFAQEAATAPAAHEDFAAETAAFTAATGDMLTTRITAPTPTIEARIAAMDTLLVPQPDYVSDFTEAEGARIAPIMVATEE